ncbi:hypothetical protein ISCGN_011380 [Ixodes scapularis]
MRHCTAASAEPHGILKNRGILTETEERDVCAPVGNWSLHAVECCDRNGPSSPSASHQTGAGPRPKVARSRAMSAGTALVEKSSSKRRPRHRRPPPQPPPVRVKAEPVDDIKVRFV